MFSLYHESQEPQVIKNSLQTLFFLSKKQKNKKPLKNKEAIGCAYIFKIALLEITLLPWCSFLSGPILSNGLEFLKVTRYWMSAMCDTVLSPIRVLRNILVYSWENDVKRLNSLSRVPRLVNVGLGLKTRSDSKVLALKHHWVLLGERGGGVTEPLHRLFAFNTNLQSFRSLGAHYSFRCV